jgi:hypothetical protein
VIDLCRRWELHDGARYEATKFRAAWDSRSWITKIRLNGDESKWGEVFATVADFFGWFRYEERPGVLMDLILSVADGNSVHGKAFRLMTLDSPQDIASISSGTIEMELVYAHDEALRMLRHELGDSRVGDFMFVPYSAATRAFESASFLLGVVAAIRCSCRISWRCATLRPSRNGCRA